MRELAYEGTSVAVVNPRPPPQGDDRGFVQARQVGPAAEVKPKNFSAVDSGFNGYVIYVLATRRRRSINVSARANQAQQTNGGHESDTRALSSGAHEQLQTAGTRRRLQKPAVESRIRTRSRAGSDERATGSARSCAAGGNDCHVRDALSVLMPLRQGDFTMGFVVF